MLDVYYGPWSLLILHGWHKDSWTNIINITQLKGVGFRPIFNHELSMTCVAAMTRTGTRCGMWTSNTMRNWHRCSCLWIRWVVSLTASRRRASICSALLARRTTQLWRWFNWLCVEFDIHDNHLFTFSNSCYRTMTFSFSLWSYCSI